MGHKINPIAIRLGIIFDWKSRWLNLKKYKNYLEQDYLLRKFITKKYQEMGLANVEIERTAGVIRIIMHTAKPGLIIGRGGTGVEELRKELEKKIKETAPNEKLTFRLDVQEVARPDANAKIVAQNIAQLLEQRMPFRRVLKQYIEKVMQNKEALGVKIKVSGRLDGNEISRDEKLHRGRLPLQTLRANIDYGVATAFCTYGTIGIKVWIYKGEIFNADTKKS